MPLGIQFQATQGREDLLLQIAKLFEDEKMLKCFKFKKDDFKIHNT